MSETTMHRTPSIQLSSFQNMKTPKLILVAVAAASHSILTTVTLSAQTNAPGAGRRRRCRGSRTSTPPSFRCRAPASITNMAVAGAAARQRCGRGDYDIEFIGDSITQGWEGAGKNVWAEFYGKRKVINFGVGGDRTQHVLWRFEQGPARRHQGQGCRGH